MLIFIQNIIKNLSVIKFHHINSSGFTPFSEIFMKIEIFEKFARNDTKK